MVTGRPDHGRRMSGGEHHHQRGAPGGGLYDRALGIQFPLGVWHAVRYER
jgi:mannonate dehydratase